MNSEEVRATGGSDTGAPSKEMSELLIVEYDARLQRFRQLAGHQSQLQHWALVSSGALWAWVLSRPQSGELVAACWIPVVANTFFYTKTRLLSRIAKCIYCRLNVIVRAVGHDDPRYVTEWVPENWDPWSKLFWGAVMVLSIGMALAYTVRFFA